MALTSWWKLAAGAAFGALIGSYLPAVAFMMAILLGTMLAWASLKKNDPDDVMTPVAAGYLVGVLGFGLIHLTLRVMGYPV